VRDPHDVVAVGDQVRVWVASIDKERRRVALTMILPGTEKPQPAKSRKWLRRGPAKPRRPEPTTAAPPPATEQPTVPDAAERKAAPPRRANQLPRPDQPRREQSRQDRPRRDRGRGGDRRPQRQGAYEKRAPKELVPITKAMEEGKEFLRSFGDLLQFHKKKQEHEEPTPKVTEPVKPAPTAKPGPTDTAANGTLPRETAEPAIEENTAATHSSDRQPIADSR
jgi:hypothetical protein